MGVINGFATDSLAVPVKYVDGVPAGWGQQPAPGTWQPTAGPVEVVTRQLKSEEKVRAGIDAATKAMKLYFKLVDGSAPFTEADTLDVSATETLSGERYDVKSVLIYDRSGFPAVGVAEVTKTGRQA